MTKELITRAEIQGTDMQVRWMLVSGQEVKLNDLVSRVQQGIQLYVATPDGRSVRVDLDVHDAGELHQALEAHMENVATQGAKPMTPEERDRALRKDRIRKGNLRAIQDEIDNPLRPRLVKGNGEEYTGPRVIVPSDEYRDLLAASRRTDPEFLAAMEDVLEVWTNNGRYASVHHPGRINGVRDHFPALAAALDRLAELNA